MKCLLSKGHFCSLSGGIYPVKDNNDCALALDFNIERDIKKCSSVSITNIKKKKIVTEINRNYMYYLMLVVKDSSIEHRCPRHIHEEMSSLPLAVITLPGGCSLFTPDFIIPAINTFQPKHW